MYSVLIILNQGNFIILDSGNACQVNKLKKSAIYDNTSSQKLSSHRGLHVSSKI